MMWSWKNPAYINYICLHFTKIIWDREIRRFCNVVFCLH